MLSSSVGTSVSGTNKKRQFESSRQFPNKTFIGLRVHSSNRMLVMSHRQLPSPKRSELQQHPQQTNRIRPSRHSDCHSVARAAQSLGPDVLVDFLQHGCCYFIPCYFIRPDTGNERKDSPCALTS